MASSGVEWRPHPLQYVYFSVDDLEAARQRCISAGARNITDIGKMLWGETMFYAVDPFGNPILTESLTAPLSWAQRLKRVFNIDITLCPLCGGQLRVIEDVTDADLIRKILNHVQQHAPPRRPEACAQPHQTLPDLFAGR